MNDFVWAANKMSYLGRPSTSLELYTEASEQKIAKWQEELNSLTDIGERLKIKNKI